MEASQELEQVPTSRLAEVLSGMGEAEIESTATPQETSYRIIAEILAAESEDEMLAELPVWGSKDSVGKTFEVQNVRGVFRSKVDNPDGNKGYLACTVVDVETGEVGVLTTSAVRLAARIGWWHEHDAFPVTIEVYKRATTEQGFDVLDCRKVDA
jgi:hypothetical protein